MAAIVNGTAAEGGASGERGAGNEASGESITLADVKVGDSVAGRGAVKNGLFVATELGVMDAAARRQRRRAMDGSGDSPTGAPGSVPRG
jgi:hypothetical protein